MKLSSLRLKYFQCYRDSDEIQVYDLTIFIGENDCGKTSILKALELFFNNNEQPTEDLFLKIGDEQKKKILITCKFIIDEEDAGNYPPRYVISDGIDEQKYVEITKIYFLNGYPNRSIIKCNYFQRDEYNRPQRLMADELRLLFDDIEELTYGMDDLTGIAARTKARNDLEGYIKENFDDLIKTIKWDNLIWSEIEGYLPQFESYSSSAYRDPKTLITRTLRDVYRSFFYDYDEVNNQWKLKRSYSRLKTRIERKMNEQVEDLFRNKIQSIIEKIQKISGTYEINFDVGFSLSDIEIDYGEGNRSIQHIGEGTKKRLFLAIMEWDQEYRSREDVPYKIRYYDEPDASLHYGAQKEMYYTLTKVTKESNTQVLINTHSIAMIDRAPPRIINHVLLNAGTSTIFSLQGDEEQEIKDFLDNISGISGIKNSSLFFERCFLIVEGDTEMNALKIIYNKVNEKSMTEDGVVMINLQTNATWKAFLKLMNRNKSDCTILFFDNEIQSDRNRRITYRELENINFPTEFLDNNVILVGENEFEDVFSNEIICRCLNLHWPKVEGEIWSNEEIQALRGEAKFSDALMRIIQDYRHNHDVEFDSFQKPEFGKRLAETISVDEISQIDSIRILLEKISDIIA